MAPPKKGELLKGQSSLSTFFSGGGLATATSAQSKRASEAPAAPSPQKKQTNSSSNKTEQQKVTELKEKVSCEV